MVKQPFVGWVPCGTQLGYIHLRWWFAPSMGRRSLSLPFG